MGSAAEPELSEFLLHTSHDMRTALRAIRVHTDLLLKSGLAAPVPGLEERLGFIAGGAQKIDLLAEGLASLAIALQMRQETFQLTPMNVLLRTVLAKLSRDLQAQGAQVEHDKLPRVIGDPDRLMEVFENLLRNALQHRGANPPVVRITVEKRPEEWLFAVRDNGPGLQEPYLENIFRPFVRLRANGHAGPGLGLTTCRIIVQQHGGKIWAESEGDRGASFLFTLPASAD